MTHPLNDVVMPHLESVLAALPPEYKMTVMFRHVEPQGDDVVISNDDVGLASQCLARKVKDMRATVTTPTSEVSHVHV